MDLNGLPVDLEQFIRQELAKGKYHIPPDLVVKFQPIDIVGITL